VYLCDIKKLMLAFPGFDSGNSTDILLLLLLLLYAESLPVPMWSVALL